MNVENFIDVDPDDFLIAGIGDQGLKLGDDEKDGKEGADDVEDKKSKTSQKDDETFDTDDFTPPEDNSDKNDDNPQFDAGNDDDDDGKKSDDEDIQNPKDSINNDGGEDDGDNSPQENLYSAFAEELAQKGYFPYMEDEDISKLDNLDDIFTNLQEQVLKSVDDYKSAFRQNAIENLIAEGAIKAEDVIDDGLKIFTEDQIKSSVENAKSIFRMYYSSKNIPEDEIEDIIKNTEDLEGRALKLNQYNYQTKIQKDQDRAERMAQEETRKAEEARSFNNKLKQNVNAYDEFIPGKKVRPRDKQLVVEKMNDTLAKVNKDLTKYLPILSYLDMYGILDGDFSKVMKQGESQATSKMKQMFEDSKKRKTNAGTRSRQTSSNLTIDDTGVPNIYQTRK